MSPAIDPNLLAHPIDLEVTVTQIRNLDVIMVTKPFVDRFNPNGATIPPNTERMAEMNDEEVK